jgi:CheY-like chemotaxis protein
VPESDVILLVEDDPNDALIIQQLLSRIGITHRIVHVKDGWEAINYLLGKAPFGDRSSFPVPILILLDINLPKYDGFDVLTWLRSKPAFAELPIVVLTGSPSPEHRKRAIDLGANGFEVKPVEPADFTAVANSIRVRLPPNSSSPSD